jgi:hypothetical protein
VTECSACANAMALNVVFHVFGTSGKVGCDVNIVNPTCPSYLEKSESALFREAEQAKTRKRVLNGATMVPLVMSTSGKLGLALEGHLQNLASVACSTGVVDPGVWLRISCQFLSCALVHGRGIAFRHYYRTSAKSAGKDFCDGAVVPFE